MNSLILIWELRGKWSHYFLVHSDRLRLQLWQLYMDSINYIGHGGLVVHVSADLWNKMRHIESQGVFWTKPSVKLLHYILSLNFDITK